MSHEPLTLSQAARWSSRHLEEGGVDSPCREADLILGLVKGWSEARVLAHPKEVLSPDQEEKLKRLVRRRARGEPFAYLAGRREFYGRSFLVDPRVLIPRPETEHLVESALARCTAAPRILDVCTGSGCVAISLAAERPKVQALATDIRPEALALARANAIRHGVEQRVLFAAQDLVSGLNLDHIDLVVANPPYVDIREAPNLPRDVKNHEPAHALFGGKLGLEVMHRLLRDLRPLAPGTPVLLEMGKDQLDAIGQLATDWGFLLTTARSDLSGRPRIVELERGPG